MSGPDSSAPPRPQLDPHAVWAQNAPGKGNGSPETSLGRDGQAAATAAETDMAEPQFAIHSDDDLPRTLRRERDARRQAQSYQQHAPNGSGPSIGDDDKRFAPDEPGTAPPATVTDIDVPFLRLMAFFLKCSLAAIPALIVLGLIMFAMGQIAEKVFPWLVKMRIVITFPG